MSFEHDFFFGLMTLKVTKLCGIRIVLSFCFQNANKYWFENSIQWGLLYTLQKTHHCLS